MNLGISQITKQALGELNENWGITVLLSFIIFLMVMLGLLVVEIPLSGGFSQWLNQEQSPVTVDIFQFVYSIALMPFNNAAYWFYLNPVRGENPEIPQVFSIYQDSKNTLKLAGAYLMQNIYIFTWTILFIIPGIIKSLSYSQTSFLMKDHPEYPVKRAISKSKITMKGYKWKYFLMNLNFIGWGILSVLPLGIGLL